MTEGKLVIKRVTHATEEVVLAFDKLIPQLTKRQSPSLAELDALVASQSVLLIARYPDDTGPIIGSGTLGIFRTPTGVHAHIEDVVVDESFRGLGIGEALVRQLLDTAKELEMDGVSLTCNPAREAANKLYEKMGFSKWETNVYWFSLNQGHDSINES